MPEKTHMISVRLTDAERRKLSQICAVSGLPVSAAIREMIGGITIRQRPPQELHDLYVEINRIGKNINQIVRKANAGFATKSANKKSIGKGRKREVSKAADVCNWHRLTEGHLSPEL